MNNYDRLRIKVDFWMDTLWAHLATVLIVSGLALLIAAAVGFYDFWGPR